MLERRWLMRAIGIIGQGTVLACLVGLCLIAGRAGAAGPSPEYLALLEAARAEGKATIGGFAFDPEEIATLEKGFKKRFGFPIKLTHDPTHIRDLPPKVIAGGFDVVELNVAGGHQVMESPRGLVQVEWSMFAHEFPQLDAINRQRPAQDTPCLLYLNAIFGMVYNTKLVKEQELPETLEDFADPKWKGRFVLWDNGNPFDFIAQKYGKERALELARKLKANKPILSRSAAILTLIASGEAALGTTAITATLGEINKGAPLGVKPYKDIIPALNNQICVVGKSPHPNMAKLFAAWHATEGIGLIADSAGHYRALPGDDNALTKLLAKWGKTVDDFTIFPDRAAWKQREEVTKAVSAILTGAQ
jgi:iron(III) transport system substrate-binding protein